MCQICRVSWDKFRDFATHFFDVSKDHTIFLAILPWFEKPCTIHVCLLVRPHANWKCHQSESFECLLCSPSSLVFLIKYKTAKNLSHWVLSFSLHVWALDNFLHTMVHPVGLRKRTTNYILILVSLKGDWLKGKYKVVRHR